FSFLSVLLFFSCLAIRRVHKSVRCAFYTLCICSNDLACSKLIQRKHEVKKFALRTFSGAPLRNTSNRILCCQDYAYQNTYGRLRNQLSDAHTMKTNTSIRILLASTILLLNAAVSSADMRIPIASVSDPTPFPAHEGQLDVFGTIKD